MAIGGFETSALGASPNRQAAQSNNRVLTSFNQQPPVPLITDFFMGQIFGSEQSSQPGGGSTGNGIMGEREGSMFNGNEFSQFDFNKFSGVPPHFGVSDLLLTSGSISFVAGGGSPTPNALLFQRNSSFQFDSRSSGSGLLLLNVADSYGFGTAGTPIASGLFRPGNYRIFWTIPNGIASFVRLQLISQDSKTLFNIVSGDAQGTSSPRGTPHTPADGLQFNSAGTFGAQPFGMLISFQNAFWNGISGWSYSFDCIPQ
jgi:hypothetical protein